MKTSKGKFSRYKRPNSLHGMGTFRYLAKLMKKNSFLDTLKIFLIIFKISESQVLKEDHKISQ